MDEERREIIEAILDIEVEMFRRVRTGEEPSCRAHLEDMKLHRRGQFAGWSTETCASYLRDLRGAQGRGDNLMTRKYARMDGLIPPLSDSPRVAQICDRYLAWQAEIVDRFPNVMRRARDLEDFRRYMEGELETYSDRTLELLWTDVETARREDRNLSRDVYESLARQSGYQTLEEMERAMA